MLRSYKITFIKIYFLNIPSFKLQNREKGNKTEDVIELYNSKNKLNLNE